MFYTFHFFFYLRYLLKWYSVFKVRSCLAASFIAARQLYYTHFSVVVNTFFAFFQNFFSRIQAAKNTPTIAAFFTLVKYRPQVEKRYTGDYRAYIAFFLLFCNCVVFPAFCRWRYRLKNGAGVGRSVWGTRPHPSAAVARPGQIP
jgi:hypothetical protein